MDASLSSWYFFAFTSLLALGYKIETIPDGVMLVVMMVVVIRELFFLWLLLSEKSKVSNIRKIRKSTIFFTDIGLFVFTCIAFSSIWNTISFISSSINEKNIILTLLNLIAASIVFLCFFLSTRMMYILEILSLDINSKERKGFYISATITFLTAMWSLFK